MITLIALGIIIGIEALMDAGLLGVFLVSVALNLIPFFGPSNTVLAAAIAAILRYTHPLAIAVSVALGASLAKTVHYYAAFLGRKFLSHERKIMLEEYGKKAPRWAPLALFMAAASPIPDEPIILPLGLMRYSPLKFFIAFFLGKTIATSLGAYLGRFASSALEPYLDITVTALASVALTIIVTFLLIRRKPHGGFMDRDKRNKK
ncbi:VTT domain-containing protein [Candidatus Bathyarchaeota archaeon]|nr:VTT domain-containing protein [Candidatus Bathyarchaeota archaeon]MBS7627791.1 VTT domain-containing protein [Candidatus Bathyarchaeota archaeon]